VLIADSSDHHPLRLIAYPRRDFEQCGIRSERLSFLEIDAVFALIFGALLRVILKAHGVIYVILRWYNKGINIIPKFPAESRNSLHRSCRSRPTAMGRKYAFARVAGRPALTGHDQSYEPCHSFPKSAQLLRESM
jgi:hypothetical protein